MAGWPTPNAMEGGQTSRGGQCLSGEGRKLCGMGSPIPAGLQGHSWDGNNGSQSGRLGAVEAGSVAEAGQSSGVGNAIMPGSQGCWPSVRGESGNSGDREQASTPSDDGFWSDSTWHLCRDGKSRRIPSGSQHIFQRMVDEFSEELTLCGLRALASLSRRKSKAVPPCSKDTETPLYQNWQPSSSKQ